jgi:Putative adhesin
MNRTETFPWRRWLALAGFVIASNAMAASERPIDDHRVADPAGSVEIINVSGKIEVEGWDKPELAVTGTLGANVDRVDITVRGQRTTVRVVTHEWRGIHLGWSSEPTAARLKIRMPRTASLVAQLVSSDFSTRGLTAAADVQTVSGDVDLVAASDVRVHSVSGDVHVQASPQAALLDLETVSGDLRLDGGAGDLSVNSVSGNAHFSSGRFTRVRLKTVSGDMSGSLGLSADGRLEAESVSGDLSIKFAGGLPPADFDLRSLSGDVQSCRGHTAERSSFGPGSRLNFREGAGTARVRAETKSGDLSVCTD